MTNGQPGPREYGDPIDEHWDPNDERTRVLPTQPGPVTANGAHPVGDPHRTRVQPMSAAPEHGATRPGPVTTVPERTDPRGTAEWDHQAARLSNRPSTDLGLLLLRLCSLPLVLHGIHKATGFAAFVDTVRGNPIGAMAPEAMSLAVVTGQIVLPVLIAVGFLTRLAGTAQAVMMGAIYAFFVLANAPVIDARTGGLSGEAALAFAAIALPLLLTGPGRFSLDHAMTAKGRERRIAKRTTKRLNG